MLSILIPTYNYDVRNLIKKIHKQVTNCNIDFEILYLEDGSNPDFVKQNSKISNLLNVKQLVSNDNLGSIGARQTLSDNSIYNWLLFLDADTIPKEKTFIDKYILQLHSNFDAIYGGCAYKEDKPENDNVLRWKYGKKKEQVAARRRNKTPYEIITSSNFLIKKEVFHNTNDSIKMKGYGLDNYFSSLLKRNKYKVLHIDNEVYHLGIETSKAYLSKTEEAISNLLHLQKQNKIPESNNKLLRTFLFSKSIKLNHLLNIFFKLFSSNMKNNLMRGNPSISIFQLYKISFMCHKDLN